MKNQKSRRINRKQSRRKTIKRKTIKRKTIKRKTTKRKQNKKIVYNQKKMYGGKFGEYDTEILKISLERFNFNEKELEEVMRKLGLSAHHLSGHNLIQLISQYQSLNIKEEFFQWLDDVYMDTFEDDGTDNEDNDDDE